MEAILVDAFFIRERRKRVKFNLASEKRRSSFLWNIGPNLFIEKYQYPIRVSIAHYNEIDRLLDQISAPKQCYLLTDQGEWCNRPEALHSIFYGKPVVISLIPGKLALYSGEQCYGPPERMFLAREEGSVALSKILSEIS